MVISVVYDRSTHRRHPKFLFAKHTAAICQKHTDDHGNKVVITSNHHECDEGGRSRITALKDQEADRYVHAGIQNQMDQRR